MVEEQLETIKRLEEEVARYKQQEEDNNLIAWADSRMALDGGVHDINTARRLKARHEEDDASLRECTVEEMKQVAMMLESLKARTWLFSQWENNLEEDEMTPGIST